ncbi:protein of unknown function [Pseudomonas mediterranea]
MAVPGEPGTLGGLTGIVGCWACAQLIESAARAMAVRMLHFITGSVATVIFRLDPTAAVRPSS